MTHHDHPVVVVEVQSGDARLVSDRDGAILNVVIQNLLPCVSTVPCYVFKHLHPVLTSQYLPMKYLSL